MSEYFSHDAHARHDKNIIKLINEYGMTGYGWYWIIVEMLREQKNYKLDLEDDIEIIAYETKTDLKTISEFLDKSVKIFKLFKKSGKKLYSDSLLKRMKMMNEKKEKARKAIKTRWERRIKENTDVIRTYNGRNTNVIQLNQIKLNKKSSIKKDNLIRKRDDPVETVETVENSDDDSRDDSDRLKMDWEDGEIYGNLEGFIDRMEEKFSREVEEGFDIDKEVSIIRDKILEKPKGSVKDLEKYLVTALENGVREKYPP